MRALLKENLIEALIGALVLLAGIWFVVFAYQRTSGGASAGGDYTVTARFPNVSGVAVGTDVRLSGMKVGTVAAERLDPQSYQAVLELSLDDGVKLPADTAAAITAEGILGGSYIALQPGGETAYLKDGDEIMETQGSVDLMGLIGQVINRTGSAPAEGEAKE
jgi:phospholipid/cholesterol/gamma-HCH transport system substrate-binding protein